MGRPIEIRDLHPSERRAALMRAAGSTLGAIAVHLETSEPEIRAILGRPHVSRFLMRLQATCVESASEACEALNETIRTTAEHAFEIEKRNMDELDEMGQYADEPHVQIRAKLGAIATAQDILDRAGNRAPTRTINTNLNTQLPSEAVEHLAQVLKEVGRGVGSAKPSSGVGEDSIEVEVEHEA